MSNTLDRLRGVTHLPIFPLPLVLMPHEVLPLHIFEDRYRQMIKDIEAEGNLFGISLLDETESRSDRPVRGSVGCVAEIRESNALPDGRSNIITLGIIRYGILDYADRGEPYLVGKVECFEDDGENPARNQILAGEVAGLLERIATAISKMTGRRSPTPAIERTDPESFSYRAAAALMIENKIKYQLLATTSTARRLEMLQSELLKNVDRTESVAEIRVSANTNGHSKLLPDV